MARIERTLTTGSYWKKALGTAPSVAVCAKLFRNWWRLTRIFAGQAEFTPPIEAIGRKGYRLRLLEAGDVETLWDVFCLRSYRVPVGAKIIVDAGANIGAFSLYALKETAADPAARVYAIEPVAASFARLQNTVAENGLAGRAICHAWGIAGVSGPRTIRVGGAGGVAASKNASLYLAPEDGSDGPGVERIETVSLADLLARLELKQVDFLKMDCEGAEVEALMAADDATLRRCRAIGMEYHFYRGIADTPRLFDRLTRAGFVCAAHNPGKRTATFLRQDG